MHQALIHKALAAIVFAWLALLAALPVWAQGAAGTQLQPVPELTARIIDQTGTLSPGDLQSLSEQLKKLEDETGAQVAVLMVATTAPEDIAAYSWRVASSWRLGRKDIGDGSLIVVAKNDRRMRIEVARKLEGAIPDIQAARIIDSAMKPRFRADDYAGGLSAAIEQMSLLIHGEKLPAPQSQPRKSGKSWADQLDFLLPLLFFGFPIGIAVARAIFGRVLGSLLIGGVAGVAAYVITASLLIAGVAGFVGLIFTLLSNLSRGGGGPYIGTGGGGGGGGGWSSGGGGGFSSGGGGSFGGGGASGDW
ncbi:TPM domain-containing protein [Comamonas testosteroni]|uniref:TPM domain-containing protein n=1 Tax=Comamonas testosteroni TaxID=285 RepID=UPI0015FE7175|nr:TPM domain-containing protein [Comamonas testosteroni]